MNTKVLREIPLQTVFEILSRVLEDKWVCEDGAWGILWPTFFC